MKKIIFFGLTLILFLSFSFINVAAPYFPVAEFVADLPYEYRDLCDIVPVGALCGDSVQFEDLASSLGGEAFFPPFFHRLISDGVIVPPRVPSESNLPEDNPDAPRIEGEKVRSAFEKMYGRGSFSRLEETDVLTDGKNYLCYDASVDGYSYIYSPRGMGGDYAQYPYYKCKSAEKREGEVVLYLYYGVFSQACPVDEFYIYGSDSPDGYVNSPHRLVLIHAIHQPKYDIRGYEMLSSGALDEYLPVYKHTFKDNGRGGYYWFSSEQVESGSPIPAELFPEEQASVEEGPSSGESTQGQHTILGGNWGSASTQPSTDTEQATDGTSATDVQQTPDDGDAAPLWGIVVGWGCVAAALAVGAGLLLKRYKK